MEKITLNTPKMTIEEAFQYFLFAKNAQGLTEKTIESYRDHCRCISKYLDTSIALSDLKKEDTQQMIASMREKSDNNVIENEEFIRACMNCDVDPYSFTQKDLDELQSKLNQIT